jgi:CheY-like chemotaxis protein
MGGEIGVDSTPVGSTFWFTAVFQKQSARVVEIGSRGKHPRRHILVVDDNATNRFVLQEQLRVLECQVEEADSGEAALKLLRQAVEAGIPSEVGLLDMEMPSWTGLNLGRLINADERLRSTIVLVMLSSRCQRGDSNSPGLRICGLPHQAGEAQSIARCPGDGLGPGIDPSRQTSMITRHTFRGQRRDVHILLAEDNPTNGKWPC